MGLNRRIANRSFPGMRPVVLGVAFSCLIFAPGAAQSVRVSPRVSIMEGHDFAWSAGLRGEVGSLSLSGFAQVGVFHVAQRCDLVFPPLCNTPSIGGGEFLGGVRLSLPRIGLAQPAVSLGAGALVWEDDQPFESGVGNIWEAELRATVKAFSWADVLLGATLKNIGQSVSGGMRLTRDRGTYGGLVIGLLIPARRR